MTTASMRQPRAAPMVELPGIILVIAQPRRSLMVSWGLGKVVHEQSEAREFLRGHQKTRTLSDHTNRVTIAKAGPSRQMVLVLMLDVFGPGWKSGFPTPTDYPSRCC
jgi:hypothetical protein